MVGGRGMAHGGWKRDGTWWVEEGWHMVGGRGVARAPYIIIIIIIITAIELSLGNSSPYTSTDKTNKNKYT